MNPPAETIQLRRQVIDGLLSDVNASKSADLARFVFGLPKASEATWFVDAFRFNDDSFSLVDNAVEAAVLSGVLLSAAMDTEEIRAILAFLSAYAGGQRQPLCLPLLVDQARRAFFAVSVKSRAAPPSSSSLIKTPAKSKAANIAAVLESQDWQKVAEAIKANGDDAIRAVEALANQVTQAIRPIEQIVTDLHEEINILWWHIGEWSRLTEKPFAEYPAGTAAVLAALDLADLSATLRAPASSVVLLERCITKGREADGLAGSIEAAVDGLSDAELEDLALPEKLSEFADVCPVLAAFAKAQEIGRDDGAWHKAFTKATGLDPRPP
ncbi:hypothetical protein AJ87_14935 [Rhizobium yanglingense]|nr:hypothetical protein AJ87_14935 [Rhizobium yanglingense]